jgi:hypothetical protein
MRELIPSYIYDMSVRNKNKGTFNSSTLFMDISGFTQMTEALMKKGKEGAEVISVILNNIFEPIINAVYDRDGFISSFAGDAMTIIFEGDRSKRSHIKALFSALYINKLFKEKGLQKTRLGDFNLSIKLGLSFGKVDWGIVGKDIHKTYYFRGEAIDGCANSEHHCDKMDIVIDDKFFNLFDKGKLEITNAGEDLYSEGESNVSYFKLIKSNVEGDELNLYVSPNLKKEVLKSFILEEVLNFDQIGEFRDIVSLFISFKEPENFEKLNELASLVWRK